MADIKLPDDLLFPIPESDKEKDLYKTLQDYSKGINDTFANLEDIEKITAGTGIVDTSNTFSIDVDGTSIQVGGSGLEVIDGGVDHDSLANTHNLTTDIDHDNITNAHNLTTDIDHHALTNFTTTEHFTMIDDDSMATASATTAATSESIKAYVDSSGGGGAGNIVFSWAGVDNAANATHGMYKGTSLTPDISSGGGEYMFLANDGTTARTLLNFRFTKISSISNIAVKARLWAESSASDREAILTVKINTTLTTTATSSASATPTWYDGAALIDVSGLSNGTYDGIIQLSNELAGETSYCSGVMLIAS